MNARSRRLRFFSLALAVLGLCMVLLCGCRPAEEKADSSPAELPVIVVGSDNYPPFNYTGSDGQPTGVDVELAQEAFRRLGYRVQFVTINWEEKKTLVENGTIDCAWGSFSMNGREDEYTWAGPYLHSRQVVAVRTSSDIYTLADLADKTLVVQSTTKPEELFLDAAANGLPQLRAVYSLQDRDLIYTTRKRHPAVYEGLQRGVPHSGRAADAGGPRRGLCQGPGRWSASAADRDLPGNAGRWHHPGDRVSLPRRTGPLSGGNGGQQR